MFTKRIICAFVGRFQPPHPGHIAAANKFLAEIKEYYKTEKNVSVELFYVTSNTVKQSSSNFFNFEERKRLLTTLFGIDGKHIIKNSSGRSLDTLHTQLLLNKQDKIILGLGQKDYDLMEETEWFSKKPFYDHTAPPAGQGISLHKIDMQCENVSASEIRTAIKINDIDHIMQIYKEKYTNNKDLFDQVFLKIVHN